MNNAVIDSIFQELRLSSITSSSPESMKTLRSPNDLSSFCLMNSSLLGNDIGFVNSISKFLLADIVPILISGGLGISLLLVSPDDDAVAAAAYLASSLYFRIVE